MPEKKLSQLPPNVLDWISSFEASENTFEIAKKFNLAKNQVPIIAKLTGQVVLEVFPLEELPLRVAKELQIEPILAKKIASEIAIKQFAPIKDYLKGVEEIVVKWGGILSKVETTPHYQTFKNEEKTDTISEQPPVPVIQKTIKEAVKENPEVLNQEITSQPIKLKNQNQVAKPTINNWLSDFISEKGAWYQDFLQINDYIFNNPNAKSLSEKERFILFQIIKSYNSNSPLPFSAKTGLLLKEELLKNFEQQKQEQTSQPAPFSPRRSSSSFFAEEQVKPTSPFALSTPGKQSQESASSPLEPLEEPKPEIKISPPPRPAPKLNGNVIDLKNLGNNRFNKSDE